MVKVSSTAYDKQFEKIEFRTEYQNHSYGGRLDKGITYRIGSNAHEEYFLTLFDDNQLTEFWMRAEKPGGSRIERTLVKLKDYEVGRIIEMHMERKKLFLYDSEENDEDGHSSD